MNSKHFKIFIISSSFFFGLLVWPRILTDIASWFGLWSYMYVFEITLTIYLLFWILLFIFDYNMTLSKNLFNSVVKVILLSAFLIEIIGIQFSLPIANTLSCELLASSDYNGFRVANTAAFIGGLSVFIYLFFSIIYRQIKFIKNPKNYQYNHNGDKSEQKSLFIQDNSLYCISTCLLFFHISFLFPSTFRSIGCNGIPENLITPIGVFWIFPGLFCIIYLVYLKVKEFRKEKTN